jgi:hypothetical protein
MNTFKRKSLYAALAGVGVLGVTGAAQAVNVNPDGLGQALIYPYYTTNGLGTGGTVAPYNSLLSVVNTTGSGKVVKVRFIEGRASKEVLDFNLWLSPFDVWTAAIIPSGAGAGIFTTDLSCTTPTVSSNSAAPTNFVNFAYVGDPELQTLARTKEGYVEIIEMGNVTGGTLANITHAQPSPPGTPPGCSKLPTGATAPTDLVTGNGGLFGGISLINVLAGGDITENAVALSSFTASTLWAPAGYILPDLSEVNPQTSVVFNQSTTTGTAQVVATQWAAAPNALPVDAVSAVLMVEDVLNEYVLDPGTKSGTDWVVTEPTKHFYYNSSFNVLKLFQRNFRLGGACDDLGLTIYNREEQSVLGSFSPPPPTVTNSMCWEANVLTFNNTNVLLSNNSLNIPVNFPNGWVDLNLSGGVSAPVHQLIGGPTLFISTADGATTTAPNATYNGLPVIGFAAQYFNNGTLAAPGATVGVQAFYTGAFAHRYDRNITPVEVLP